MRFLLGFLLLLFAIPLAKAQFSPGPSLATGMTLGGVQTLIGSTSSTGHTTAGMSLVFGTIAIGGTTVTQTGITDPVSGFPPSVGALCYFGNNTATPFPVTVLFRCTVTATGTVQVTAYPLTGLGIAVGTLTGNIFWTW